MTDPTALNKYEHKAADGTRIIYVTYEMPAFDHSTRINQAKPLLEAIALELPIMNNQAKQLYDKQNEIADHYQQEIERLSEKADADEDKLKRDIEELANVLSDKERLIKEITDNYENNLKDKDKEIKEKQEEIKKKNDELLPKDQQTKTTQDKLIATEKAKEELEKVTNDSLSYLENANQEIARLKKEMEKLKSDCYIIEQDEAVDKLKQRLSKATSLRSEESRASSSPSSSSAVNNNQGDNHSAITIKMNTTLPTFNGRPESNVNEWLYSCKRILEYSNYDGSRKVGLASSYLRDIASQDYILH